MSNIEKKIGELEGSIQTTELLVATLKSLTVFMVDYLKDHEDTDSELVKDLINKIKFLSASFNKVSEAYDKSYIKEESKVPPVLGDEYIGRFISITETATKNLKDLRTNVDDLTELYTSDKDKILINKKLTLLSYRMVELKSKINNTSDYTNRFSTTKEDRETVKEKLLQEMNEKQALWEKHLEDNRNVNWEAPKDEKDPPDQMGIETELVS